MRYVSQDKKICAWFLIISHAVQNSKTVSKLGEYACVRSLVIVLYVSRDKHLCKFAYHKECCAKNQTYGNMLAFVHL